MTHCPPPTPTSHSARGCGTHTRTNTRAGPGSFRVRTTGGRGAQKRGKSVRRGEQRRGAERGQQQQQLENSREGKSRYHPPTPHPSPFPHHTPPCNDREKKKNSTRDGNVSLLRVISATRLGRPAVLEEEKEESRGEEEEEGEEGCVLRFTREVRRLKEGQRDKIGSARGTRTRGGEREGARAREAWTKRRGSSIPITILGREKEMLLSL
ncbi:hypothetical protein SRHO_G00067340 [Serrasalmus rhombeus]